MSYTSSTYEDKDESFRGEAWHSNTFSVPLQMRSLYQRYESEPHRVPFEGRIYHDPHMFDKSEDLRKHPPVHVCKSGVRLNRVPSMSRAQYARQDTTSSCFQPVVHGGVSNYFRDEVGNNIHLRIEDSRILHNEDFNLH